MIVTMRFGNYAAAARPASEFIRDWSGRGEMLVIGATRSAVDDLVRSCCASALAGVHRFGTREFVIACSSEAMNRSGFAPVRRIGREALAALVTSRLRDANQLGYLAPVAGFPGFPRALAATIEQLRLNGISPSAVRVCGWSGPDLGLLLREYERELHDRALADHAERVRLAAAAIHKRESPFTGLPVLLFDVAPAGASESDLIRDLLAQSSAPLEIALGADAAEPHNGLSSLQRYVLSGETVPNRPPDATFEVFSASGESLECIEIARHVLDAARRGDPFDSMAVLLRSPGRYQALVADALRRAGIPAHFSRGAGRPDAAGRAFLALLRFAAENYAATAFAEYLSLDQMRRDEAAGQAPARWERLLVDAAVIGGKERWKRRLDGLAQEYLLRHNAAEDQGERARCARYIDWLEAFAGFVLPVIERLEQLPRRATWAAWFDALDELARTTFREPDTVLSMLEELEPMGEIGPVDLQQVLLVLGEHLAGLQDSADTDRYGKVFVAGIEQARGMSFRHVFVPGLNEGIFPRPVTEDPLLLDAQRAALGLELSRDDGELLRIACASASERIVMSWSRLDLSTGRQRVPSFYAFEALKAARGTEVDVQRFEQESRGATQTQLGWPAPSEAQNAVDDLEYDLSYLRSAWEHRQPGAAAYLTKVNESAVRSLRARWFRWRKAWKWPDGFVDLDMHAIAVLDAHRPGKRPWSVSALQQYARCPYRFALRGIYGLQPQERPVPLQRIDPSTRGRIYHKVQFELLRDLRARDMLPVTPANLAEVLSALSSIVARVAGRYEEQLAPSIRQVWNTDIERIHADLRGWLSYKVDHDAGWIPRFFEYSFGLPHDDAHDPGSSEQPVEALPELFLRGSIDLIEEHASGALRVVDHKTGSKPLQKIDTVGAGEHLQPVLYALTAEQMLKRRIAGGRLLYATLKQNYAHCDVPLNEISRARARQVIADIDTALRNGFLPAAPREDGCKHCEYLAVCGPWEEERVKQKSQGELHQLKTLRRIS